MEHPTDNPTPSTAPDAPETRGTDTPADRERRRWRPLPGRLGLEFAVVVFGVFAALWADARVAARAERRVEATRLEALEASIATTLEELAGFTADLRSDRTVLRGMLMREEPWTTADSLRQAMSMVLLGGLASFFPQLDVYEDLRSSGELSLLDGEVRRALSAMNARLRGVAEAQQDLMDVQHLNFDPYAVHNVDLGPLLGPYLGIDPGPAPPGAEEYQRTVASREFRNLLLFRLDLVENLLGTAGDLEDALLMARQSVEQRLQQLR